MSSSLFWVCRWTRYPSEAPGLQRCTYRFPLEYWSSQYESCILVRSLSRASPFPRFLLLQTPCISKSPHKLWESCKNPGGVVISISQIRGGEEEEEEEEKFLWREWFPIKPLPTCQLRQSNSKSCQRKRQRVHHAPQAPCLRPSPHSTSSASASLVLAVSPLKVQNEVRVGNHLD